VCAAVALAGIGGDAFALFYSARQRQVHCLQGNGAAPAGLSLEAVRAAGAHAAGATLQMNE
jgi:gamma-glutamyltranspeptidase/glutathione hydrolase